MGLIGEFGEILNVELLAKPEEYSYQIFTNSSKKIQMFFYVLITFKDNFV